MDTACSLSVDVKICPISKIACPGECIYSDIMENINVGIIVVDVAAEAIIFQNKMAHDALKDSIQTNDYRSMASLLLHTDGPAENGRNAYQPRSLRSGARVIGYTAYQIGRRYAWIIIRDITEHRLIAEQNALLAAAVQSAADAVMIMDTAGNIQYVNPAFEALTGYAKEEVLGHHPIILNGVADDQSFCNALESVMGNGEAWNSQITSRKKDGALYQENVTIAPVRNPEGDIVNYVAVKRDVSEKVRLESIAEAVNNMNNIGYIFAGIRHEIGNPLNSIKMALSVLSNNIDTYSRRSIRQYIERSMTEILRIEELLACLKSFNMFEHPSLQRIDVASFIRKFVTLVHEDFSNDGIMIKTILHPEACAMQADPRALQQVLLNILTNSADAVEDAEDPKIIIHTFKSGEYVVIRIVDNGCGMTEDQRNDLFKPFVTFKPAGTGLGLTIVRKMLSQMNCALEITSQKSAGTIVDITVPTRA